MPRLRIFADGLLLTQPGSDSVKTTLRFAPGTRPYAAWRRSDMDPWSESFHLAAQRTVISATGGTPPVATTVSSGIPKNAKPPSRDLYAISGLPNLLSRQGKNPSPSRGGIIVLPHGAVGSTLPAFEIGARDPLRCSRAGTTKDWVAGALLLVLENVGAVTIDAGTSVTSYEVLDGLDLWIRCGNLNRPSVEESFELSDVFHLHPCFDHPAFFLPSFYSFGEPKFVTTGEEGPDPPPGTVAIISNNVFCPPPTYP